MRRRIRLFFFSPMVFASLTGLPLPASGVDGTWVEPPPPTGRQGHGFVYDSAHDQFILLSGGDTEFRKDVWSLSATGSWVRLEATGTPPPGLFGVGAAYDEARHRVLQFGGKTSNVFYADVWSLGNLGGTPVWSHVTPSSSLPPVRQGAAVAIDPVRDRLIIFGGTDNGSPNFRGDTWSLSLSPGIAWSEILAPGGPGPRYAASMVYDPIRDRMLVFGGNDESVYHNDVWALSLSGSPAWTLLTPAGTPPQERQGHFAAYDPDGDRMLIGWGNTAAFEFPDDVWALDLSGIPAWTELAPTAPAPSGRWYAEGAYDSGHARLVMFGGRFISGEMPNDTWALGLGETPAWEQLAPGRAAPSFRGQHTLVFDAERHRIVTFGGVSLNPPPYNDVWTMSAPYTGSWSLVQPSGTPPITRFAHTAIVDAPRDRMIVFGGRMGTTTTTNANDLWELSLEGAPAWTPLSPTGTPPTGRSSHTAIYDPVRERMIVFGGRAGSGSGVNVNDTWELSLSGTPTWTPITTLGTPPPPMFNHSAIYDPVGDRMIVSKSQQTWALSLSGSPTWSLLSSSGPDLTSHTAIYYPVGYRMLAYGDSNPWEFDLTTNVWRQFSTTGSVLHRMGEHASVLDPDLCRMVVFAGLLGQTRNDLYWLQLPTALDVPRAGSASPLDLRLRPNPARGAIVIEFVAPHPGPVTIRVFDLAGREVNSWVRTGSDVVQRIPWDGRARHGKPVAAGIYLCTVESAGARSSKRIALVR